VSDPSPLPPLVRAGATSILRIANSISPCGCTNRRSRRQPWPGARRGSRRGPPSAVTGPSQGWSRSRANCRRPGSHRRVARSRPGLRPRSPSRRLRSARRGRRRFERCPGQPSRRASPIERRPRRDAPGSHFAWRAEARLAAQPPSKVNCGHPLAGSSRITAAIPCLHFRSLRAARGRGHGLQRNFRRK
jgi:hypothetical protein